VRLIPDRSEGGHARRKMLAAGTPTRSKLSMRNLQNELFAAVEKAEHRLERNELLAGKEAAAFRFSTNGQSLGRGYRPEGVQRDTGPLVF
jgi:hypothetical protein